MVVASRGRKWGHVVILIICVLAHDAPKLKLLCNSCPISETATASVTASFSKYGSTIRTCEQSSKSAFMLSMLIHPFKADWFEAGFATVMAAEFFVGCFPFNCGCRAFGAGAG